MMPSKKYLCEMQQVIVLIRLLEEGDNESKYIKWQLNLSQDICESKEFSCLNDTILKSARGQDTTIDYSSFGDPNEKTNTPSREKRTLSIENLEIKTDLKTKDISAINEPSNATESNERETKEISWSENTLRTSIDDMQICKPNQVDSEDFSSLQTVMHVIFQDNIHLFKKTQASKIISILIKSSKLAKFLEANEAQIRGWRIWEWAYKGEIMDHLNTKTHK